MNPKISVIVPVYNVEKYLRRCIDSILAQTFIDFELLLIDDGSKDRSGEICDEYATKDMRVRVFHNENHGVAYTRQFGMEHVTAEYFAFVDSDDFIDQQYLFLLFKEINSTQSDMTVCAYNEIGEKGNAIRGDVAYDKVSFIKALLLSKEWGVLWNKLFKKKIVDENSILFEKNIHIWEDLAFVVEYVLASSRISFVKAVLYNYDRTVAGSLTRKDTITYYKEQIEAVGKIESAVQEHGDYDLFYKELNNLKFSVKDNCIKRRITKEKVCLWKNVFPELNSEYYANSTEKISAYLLKYNMTILLKLYQGIRNIYRKKYCHEIY